MARAHKKGQEEVRLQQAKDREIRELVRGLPPSHPAQGRPITAPAVAPRPTSQQGHQADYI